ncbi:MAG: aminotransferase class V-fold PLP-dependent enzyme [Myxococcota bacterium]
MSGGTRIDCQRHLFDVPDDVAYLNCAYMGPLLRSAAEAGAAAVARKQHPWEITSSDFFSLPDRGRAAFARLIGASAEDVAVIPAVSYGIALAARNLRIEPGQEIVLLGEQFPSNVYPWRAVAKERGARIVTVDAPGEDGWTPRILDVIGRETAVVAVPHCHWTDGALIDLLALRARTREVGAALVLDVAQSCGAWPLDVAEVRPDFLVAVTYKWLLGPYSLGFLYVAPEHRGGEPLEWNWIGRAGAEDFARLVDYTDAPAPGARAFDMGERAQFQLMPIAIAAMEQIQAWGVENIAATLSERTAAIAERAATLGLRAAPPDRRAGHYLGLRFPRGVPDGLLEQLARRRVYVSVRGDSVRVTPHLFTTDQDVDRFFEALEEAL